MEKINEVKYDRKAERPKKYSCPSFYYKTRKIMTTITDISANCLQLPAFTHTSQILLSSLLLFPKEKKELDHNNLHRFRNLLSDTELRTKVGSEAMAATTSARQEKSEYTLEMDFSLLTSLFLLCIRLRGRGEN